jgi:hypothetical protein
MCGLGLLMSSTAWAGLVKNREVSVSKSGNIVTASGSLADARQSPDATQYIGCFAFANPSVESMGCHAKNKFGQMVTCFVRPGDPGYFAFRTQVRTVSASSFVFFSGVNGKCTHLQVDQNSVWLP